MRRTASERMEVIRLVEGSDQPIRQTLQQLDVPRSTFYEWYRRYLDRGFDGLEDMKPARKSWNQIPDAVRKEIVDLALEQTALSARELACRYTDEKRYFVSESTVYRLLKEQDLITSPAYVLLQASDHFKHPTKRVHELWQTDFTYLRVVGWGWYYLSTILDDFSRYIIAWRLSPTMTALDVTQTLDMALANSGQRKATVRHKPRLLSDNGPAYLSGELKDYLSHRGLTHTRGAPYHPQTQGKIERWHRSMKNVVKLEHYYLPGQLEAALKEFVDYYNNERYHESLQNVTPADVYHGRHHEIITRRAKIKRLTMQQRRKAHRAAQAA